MNGFKIGPGTIKERLKNYLKRGVKKGNNIPNSQFDDVGLPPASDISEPAGLGGGFFVTYGTKKFRVRVEVVEQ